MADSSQIEEPKRVMTLQEMMTARGMTEATQSEIRFLLGERRSLICEGKSWFEYIVKDFERMRQFKVALTDDLYLALGLLGNAADLDKDDVTYE